MYVDSKLSSALELYNFLLAENHGLLIVYVLKALLGTYVLTLADIRCHSVSQNAG